MSRATTPGDPNATLWNEFLGIAGAQTPALPRETFAGVRILITGAGGSIGSAVARAVAACEPARLVLADTSEHGLYTLGQQLSRTTAQAGMTFLLGSVTDSAFVREIFATHAPQIVFHAAAVKHVPLAEVNPITAAHTNVLGTELVLRHAVASGTRSLIHLSTDKAVEPISVLGATKRLAELLMLRNGSTTVTTAVRLPNVLGSSGSVGPLFLEQIAEHVPLTVTDRAVSRYFLSLGQTASALLYAAALRIGGIVIPEAGSPHRILDLANFLRTHSDPSDVSRTPLHFTGLRAGDKLHERLLSATENATPLSGSDLSRVTNTARTPEPQVLDDILIEVRHAVSSRDRDRLIRALQRAVPEYTPALAQIKILAPEICESPA